MHPRLGTIELTDVNEMIANQVLNYFRTGEGYPPGTFSEHLIRAIVHADSTNQGKLMRVYPGYVQAIMAAQINHDGIDRLRVIAGGRDAK